MSITDSSLRKALVDVLLPFAPDDLRMAGVPRLDRAHERFWLTTAVISPYSFAQRNRRKESAAPPDSIPCVVLKVHGDFRARLRVDSLAERVVREEVCDDRVQELCREVHPGAVTGRKSESCTKEKTIETHRRPKPNV